MEKGTEKRSKLSERNKRRKRAKRKAKKKNTNCAVCFEPCLSMTEKCRQYICYGCRNTWRTTGGNNCPLCRHSNCSLSTK